MKSNLRTTSLAIILAGMVTTTTYGNVAVDFTNFNFTPEVAATGGSGSIIDAVFRATNVASIAGSDYDALFTVTDASVDSSSAISFVDESRGDDARIRFQKPASGDIWARIDISFVDAGTSNAVDLAALANDNLRVQFDDLDSDVGGNYADYAGILTSQANVAELSPFGTDLVLDTSLQSGYTVGVYPGPDYTSDPNIFSTDPADQSPITAGFDSTAATISMVAGTTGPDSANRHVDIDMTPDFNFVPEPSSYGFLAGLLALGAAITARRRA